MDRPSGRIRTKVHDNSPEADGGEQGLRWTVHYALHVLDGFKIISHRRTEVVGGQNGPFTSWTDSDDVL